VVALTALAVSAGLRERAEAGNAAQSPPPFESVAREDPDCLYQAWATAPADTPVRAIRDWFRDSEARETELSAAQALRACLAPEGRSRLNPFGLPPHKRN
jgi:hypothetical protein